jgi:hypothetical protein
MDNRLELFARFRIVEDQSPKFLAIEGLVGLENLTVKRRDDLIPTVVARRDNFTRKRVGIDDRGAQLCQNSRYRTFP